jgi:hypothetical protein
VQARSRCEARDAEQLAQEQAALELQQALAEYISQQDTVQPKTDQGPKRAAVDDSWASLEQRVMGLNVTKLRASTSPRPSPREAPGRQCLARTPARSFRSSIGRAQDPAGANIGELVAKVARDRKARCATGLAHWEILCPPNLCARDFLTSWDMQLTHSFVHHVAHQIHWLDVSEPLCRQESCSASEEVTPVVPVDPATFSHALPVHTNTDPNADSADAPSSHRSATPAPRLSAVARSPMSSVDSYALNLDDTNGEEAALHMHTNVLAMNSVATSSAESPPAGTPAASSNTGDTTSRSSGAESSRSSQGGRIPALHDEESTASAAAAPAAPHAAAASPPAATHGVTQRKVQQAREQASSLPFGRARRASLSRNEGHTTSGAAKVSYAKAVHARAAAGKAAPKRAQRSGPAGMPRGGKSAV